VKGIGVTKEGLESSKKKKIRMNGWDGLCDGSGRKGSISGICRIVMIVFGWNPGSGAKTPTEVGV
jgi:hypothetical protein